jgi:hypothetical protein
MHIITPRVEEHTSDNNMSIEEKDESKDTKSKMNSVVSKREMTLGSRLPLQCVETTSGKVETVVETGTVCRRRAKTVLTMQQQLRT